MFVFGQVYTGKAVFFAHSSGNAQIDVVIVHMKAYQIPGVHFLMRRICWYHGTRAILVDHLNVKCEFTWPHIKTPGATPSFVLLVPIVFV